MPQRRRFLNRLAFDPDAGTLHDGDIRYMMIRGDTLMGLFARLPEPARQQALQALTDSTFEFGSKSAAKYRASGAADPAALLDVIVETAPQLGWGSWTFTERTAGGLVLEVRNSPFADGYGTSPQPVCAPIAGMLRAVSSMVLDGATAAEETTCAAQSGEVCRFTARKP
jgi:predicted hydrocarbon binding protein